MEEYTSTPRDRIWEIHTRKEAGGFQKEQEEEHQEKTDRLDSMENVVQKFFQKFGQLVMNFVEN